MSIRRMMLFTLGGFFKSIISLFKTRVLSSSGNFEAETNLETQLNVLGSDLFNSASLIITPNAYKEQTLYSIKPTEGYTNLILQSENFAVSPWFSLASPTVTKTTNAGTAPDGTNTATLITSNTDLVDRGIRQVITLFPTQKEYVFSCWVRSDDGAVITIDIGDSGTKTFNLTPTWERVSVLSTPSSSGFVDITFRANQLGKTFYIWGGQLEEGTTPGNYIKTTTRPILKGTIGDLTVTRATTATRVNEQGLIETVPYNILSYSEDFSNSYWVKTNCTVVPNSGISPIGTMTASLIVPTSTPTQIRNTTVFGVGGETYIWSCYIKSNGLRYISLTAWNSDDPVTTFDLQNGVIVRQSGPPSTAKITNVGNGWYLCEVSRILRMDYTGIWLRISPSYLENSSNLNGSNGYLIWGAQVVRSNEPKPYQLTTDRLNIPRIDYTTGSPAILVEPQRTNLLLRSEEFENSYWVKGGGVTITPNVIESPNGTLSADKFEISNNSPVMFTQFTTLTSPITLSFYIKKGNSPTSANRIGIRNGTTGKLATASINTDTGEITILSNTIGGTFSSIKMANGWFRFICTVNSNIVNGDGIYIYVGGLGSIAPNDIVGNYSYIWGAQLEAGSNATSYIPTVNGSVTRNADVISKYNIDTLIGQTEGTILVKGAQFDRGTVFRIRNNTNFSVNRLNIFGIDTEGNVEVGVMKNNVNVRKTYYLNVKKKNIIMVYSQNIFKAFISGKLIYQYNYTIPTDFTAVLNTVEFGSLSENGTATFDLIALWQTQLTDQQAIQLTTL